MAEHQALMEASVYDFSQLLFPADPSVSTVCPNAASPVRMLPWRGHPAFSLVNKSTTASPRLHCRVQ